MSTRHSDARLALAIPPDAPLHPWLGLLQRVTLAVWLPCTVVRAFLSAHRAALGDAPAEGSSR